MLVSSIARFNALNTMNNAAFASMQISNSRINTIHAFNGDQDLNLINEADKKFTLELLTNNLLYKIASLQEKFAKKQQKNKLNTLV